MKNSGRRFKQISSERASLDESARGHQYDDILQNMHDVMQYRKKMQTRHSSQRRSIMKSDISSSYIESPLSLNKRVHH